VGTTTCNALRHWTAVPSGVVDFAQNVKAIRLDSVHGILYDELVQVGGPRFDVSCNRLVDIYLAITSLHKELVTKRKCSRHFSTSDRESKTQTLSGIDSENARPGFASSKSSIGIH